MKLISLSKLDLALIWKCAINHYDNKCVRSINKGNFIYGWKIAIWNCNKDFNLNATFRELDLVLKILEMYPYVMTKSKRAVQCQLLSKKIREMIILANKVHPKEVILE